MTSEEINELLLEARTIATDSANQLQAFCELCARPDDPQKVERMRGYALRIYRAQMAELAQAVRETINTESVSVGAAYSMTVSVDCG